MSEVARVPSEGQAANPGDFRSEIGRDLNRSSPLDLDGVAPSPWIPAECLEECLYQVAAINSDLQQRLQAQQQLELRLQQERDWLLQVLQTTGAAILVVDASDRIVFVNQRVKDLLECSTSELLQHPYQTCLDRLSDQAGRSLSIQSVRESNQALREGHYTLPRLDGNLRHLTVSLTPLPESAGLGREVVLAIADITDQWQADQTLQQNADLYRQMFEASGAIKLLIEPELGAIVDANPAACKFYGYSLAQLRSKQITDLNVAPAGQIATQMQMTLADQQHYWVSRHRLASGEVRDVEVYASVLHLRGRRLFHAIIHDITERQQIEANLRLQTQLAELAKLNRLKDDFLSTISHELRTPLSSIRMAVQLLEMLLKTALPLEEPPPNSTNGKISHCLDILKEECDREITLVSDLLTLQQLEAGTQPLTPTPILLQDWLPQALETFESQLESHCQTLQVEIAPNLPPLTSDLFLLNRVVQELVTNACKFTPAGGAIAVSVGLAQPTGSWQIQVSNTGVEIPPAELSLIFDQFYRIPSHDPWKYGGTGLGLALVKRMVTYLGGQIQVTSSQGQTTFEVKLPR